MNICLHWMPSATQFANSFLLGVLFFKSCRKYKLYSTSHLYRWYIQSDQPALHCNTITGNWKKAAHICCRYLSFNIHWLDLHKAVDKRGVLGLWPHPISIWQLEVAVTMLHVYSRLTFIMARRLSCIIVPCRMQIFTWMAVITERRSSRREAWGVLFIARYSEGNECHTLVTVINDGQPSSSQLQRHLSAPSCSRSKPNGKGRAAEEELCARVFRGIPLTSPVLFQSYQCLPTLKCSLNSEWSAICFWSFW